MGRSTILHVHNVQRCGGTGNFVYDFARTFPQFRHVALCVNDPAGSEAWRQEVSDHLYTRYAPQLTRAILEEVDPLVLVLHATAGKSIEGQWPYNWLREGRTVISWHHVPTWPLLPADVDVFVSEHVKGKYKDILNLCREVRVIPPCSYMADLKRPLRSLTRPLRYTTVGKHNHELLGICAERGWDFEPPGTIHGLPGYLERFQVAVIWSGLEETWCRTVSEAQAAGLLVFTHDAGALIEHRGVARFTDAESLLKMIERCEDSVPYDREWYYQTQEDGRDFALEYASEKRLWRELGPLLMDCAVRG